MKKQTAIFFLVLVTIIWGGGFVATKLALDYGATVGAINSLRGIMFSVLVAAAFPRAVFNMSRPQLKIGLIVGTFNVAGFILQTAGAKYTAPSSSAFLTTTNVIMVPLLAWLILKQKPKAKIFVSIFICLAGMAILTGVITGGMSFNKGDVYTIGCAFAYAVSIVLLAHQPEGGHFAASAFLMGVTHFLGGMAYWLIAEGGQIPPIDWKIAILPIAYLGIGSSFVAQTIQVVTQKYLTPTTVSLIMLLEGVWGSVFSIMWGFENFTANLLAGGALIVVSLVICEVDFKFNKNKG